MILSKPEQESALEELDYFLAPPDLKHPSDTESTCREEIDYLISMHGYEYVWGKETAIQKTRGLLSDVPGKIAHGVQRIATNPDVIAMNEKLKAHAAKLNAEENWRRTDTDMDTLSSGRRRTHSKRPSRIESPTTFNGIDLNFDDDHL